MTVKSRASQGAIRCHMTWVWGCPWSSSSGGPDPPWRSLTSISPALIVSRVKPSNIAISCLHRNQTPVNRVRGDSAIGAAAITADQILAVPDRLDEILRPPNRAGDDFADLKPRGIVDR